MGEDPGKNIPSNSETLSQNTDGKGAGTKTDTSKDIPGIENQESRIKTFSEALEDISNSLAAANNGEKSKTEDPTPPSAASEPETPTDAGTEQSENPSEVNNSDAEPPAENKTGEEE